MQFRQIQLEQNSTRAKQTTIGPLGPDKNEKSIFTQYDLRRMKLKKEIQAIKELNEQEKQAQAAKAAAAQVLQLMTMITLMLIMMR